MAVETFDSLKIRNEESLNLAIANDAAIRKQVGVISELSPNLFNGEYEYGQLQNGVPGSQKWAVHCVSKIPVTAGNSYLVTNIPSDSLRFWAAFFDADSTFVSNFNTTSKETTITIPSGVAFMQPFITYNDNLSSSSVQAIVVQEIKGTYNSDEFTMYDECGLLKENISALNSGRIYFDLLVPSDFESGYINDSGAETNNTSAIRTSKFIPVDGGVPVEIGIKSGSILGNIYLYEYGENFNFIKRGTRERILLDDDTRYIKVVGAKWGDTIDVSQAGYVYARQYINDGINDDLLAELFNMSESGIIYHTSYAEKKYSSSGTNWQFSELEKAQVGRSKTITAVWGACEGFPSNMMIQLVEYNADETREFARHTVTRSNYDEHELTFTTSSDSAFDHLSIFVYPVFNEAPTSSGTAKVNGLLVVYGDSVSINYPYIRKYIDDAFANVARVPDYYESHLNSKIATIRGYDDGVGSHGDRFVFITDYHDGYYQTGNSPLLIRAIQKAMPINMVAFGGDAVNKSDVEADMKTYLSDFLDKWSGVKWFYPIIGNHEYYSNWSNQGDYKGGITLAEIYSLYNKQLEPYVEDGDGAGSYCVKNKIDKFVYYFVDCDYYAATMANSAKWVLESLESVPDDYIVVVFAHYAVNVPSESIITSFLPIANGLDAFNSHQSYTYDGVTYDYSNTSAICPLVLSGHWHRDYDKKINGINYVVTTTDNYYLGNEEGASRSAGTVSEQAFDVVSIDRANRTIYCTRIGSGSDRVFTW